MDFPIFHLDFLGNRLLIAIDAILHVLINHPLAVGGLPLVALLEYAGYYHKDARWDDLAFKVLRVFFIITTTVGAMTGVGVWFSASLVNPASIGSLIRVFFWAWFTEWLVFITEVCLILAYFLTWPKSTASQEAKRKHLKLGAALAMFSWITMALIVAILGFMMDPGNWLANRGFFSAVFNPVYIPQLAFRTSMAMVMGGLVVGALTHIFTGRTDPFRAVSLKFISLWTGAWVLPLLLSGWWYYTVVPSGMLGNLAVAIGTQEFADWYSGFKWVLLVGAVCAGATVAVSYWRPGRLHGAVYVVPVLLMFAMLGQFERVREFIRKPYVIGNYMYANGFRVEDYPLLNRDGVLKHAVYASIREITPENQIRAGKEVFSLTCTRCHTVEGVNSMRTQLTRLYGASNWQPEVISAYLGNMHGARYYMPPFPGNKAELEALAAYLASLEKRRDSLDGAQTVGLPKPELPVRSVEPAGSAASEKPTDTKGGR